MALESYKCDAGLSITGFEEYEKEQIANGNHFDATHSMRETVVKEEPTDIKQHANFNQFDAFNRLKEEIVEEEFKEVKSLNESGMHYKNQPEQVGEEKFYELDSSKLEFMPKESEKDREESKFSETREFPATDICKYMNFNVDGSDYGFVDKQENDEDNQFNERKIKNENQDYSNSSGDFLANYAVLKTNTPKTEDDIDVIYKDVKPDIFGEKSCEKSENKPYLKSIDDTSDVIKEGATYAKMDNDSRKEATNTNHSNNGQMIHSKEKRLFQCVICLKSFARKRTLKVHVRVHTGEKLFQCRICSRSFSRKSVCILHERVHTGEKPFQCKICSKSFPRSTALRYHERIHTGEIIFQCKFCSKSFSQKSAYISHERVHTGEKPFQCKICQKPFYRKQTLEEHVRTHTGEKPFQCKICLKSFPRRNGFAYHKRIHTGEKPFQCKICQKYFAWKQTLEDHVRAHSGEKPFQCNICSKSFVRKSTVSRHMKIHTDKKHVRDTPGI